MSIEKPRLRYPVIVEGKYDKIKLDSIFKADVFCTNGFGLFKDQEKQALFRRLAEQSPLLIAADPDGAGKIIRRWFSSALPSAKLIPVFLPQQIGKEPRKDAPSKEGYLGLEGLDAALLRRLFSPYTDTSPAYAESKEPITRADLFAKGLSGQPNSAEKRSALCRMLSLPENLTTPSLLRALNLVWTRREFLRLDEAGEETPVSKSVIPPENSQKTE